MSNFYSNLPDDDDESLALHSTNDDGLHFMDTTGASATPSYAMPVDNRASSYAAPPPTYDQTFASTAPQQASASPFDSRPTSSYSAPPPSIPPQTRPLSVSGSIVSPVQTVSIDQNNTHSTLDETVGQTLKRDLKNIWTKLNNVLLPRGRKDLLKDWDLWGPLLLCLVLATILGLEARQNQATAVFTGVFVLIWLGAAIVTMNAKLLGGHLSFFQSVCVLGYCVFPLVISSIVCAFVPNMVARGPIVGVCFFWSSGASLGFLADVNLGQRRILAVYPIVLFYFMLGWLIVLTKSILQESSDSDSS